MVNKHGEESKKEKEKKNLLEESLILSFKVPSYDTPFNTLLSNCHVSF